MPHDHRLQVASSRLSVARRRKEPDPAELLETERDLTATRIEVAIERALDGRPPLTDEQRERLCARLGGDS